MIIKRTHCGKGHEFTPENTGVNNRGYRHCKECNRALARVSNKKKIIRKRIKTILKKHKIVRSDIWRASELKRLKQSIESCYRAEIRAAQTGLLLRGVNPLFQEGERQTAFR